MRGELTLEKINKTQEINEKLEYIGLNLEEIPETLKLVEDLQFRPNAGFDEKKYRQYRFVSPKEIQILLSPTNRLDDIKEKYSKASPLAAYLDSKSEENQEKYDTFLRMLEEIKIEDIIEIEKEQQIINKKIPFKVRYSGNYLWQIYYSEETEQYFMIVPTEDKDYSTFFYVLKKQIEKKKAGKIFVPISNADYSRELLNKTEIQSLENYLWLFTKDWPSIYEVYDKTGKVSLQIIGETEVYGTIKSEYKVKLSNKIEATKFFKLVKALFIIQSELANYYNFETRIDRQGSLEFYYNDELMEYDKLSEWLNIEYKNLLELEKNVTEENGGIQGKLRKLKRQSQELEIEYLNKEKQISTFLECKKTFLGKVKYFFKYSGKKSKQKEIIIDEEKEEILEIKEKIDEKMKMQYTLDELIQKGKDASERENNLKKTKMDIKALKLKNFNLEKKIENLDNPSLIIQDDVVDFMANHYCKDIRSLEGALKRLFFCSIMNHTNNIDMAFALESFKDDKIVQNPKSSLTKESILKTTAEFYYLTISQLISKNKTRKLTTPREMCMYLMRELLDITFAEIGATFSNRDHSTVMKACARVETKIKKDPDYKLAINKLKDKLGIV